MADTQMVEFLQRVRERLAEETRWVKEHAALDATGETTSPESPTATQWCLLGAIEAEDRLGECRLKV